MKLKVSVIIPAYNTATYIKDSIESVLSQTFRDLECIVVDDGSTDNTREIVEGYCRQDKRVKYYYKENGGCSSARNYGMDKASGTWIQFLDSDDWIYPDKINRQLIAAEEISASDEPIIVYSDYKIRWGNGYEKEYIIGDMSKDELINGIVGRKFGLATPTPIHLNSTLLTTTYVKNNKFNEDFKNYGDLEFFYRYLQNNVKVKYVPFISMCYRLHENGISHNLINARRGYVQFLESIYKINPNDLALSPNMRSVLELFVRNRDKQIVRRSMWLIQKSYLPVYSRNLKNIRIFIIIIYKLNLLSYYFLLTSYIVRIKSKLKSLLYKYFS